VPSTLSERDVCSKFITPAIIAAGWDLHTQIREEVTFTKGRIIVRGKLHARGERKRVDYVLYYKPNIPLALIEAKDEDHALGAGMQQGLDYAVPLDIPFVYSSNGSGFLEHDRTGLGDSVERELSLAEFPSPEALWQRYCQWKELDAPEARQVIEQDYYFDGSDKAPRYYQLNAINRVIEAIAKGQKRLLLVMATGTGKTYTAFQIIWRLWKSKARKRILYLADRNILIDQTRTNDFKPFGAAMTKIQKRQVDKSYEIYLTLYQAVTGNEEDKNIYRQFSRDFFDLVIIDECHRGSAAETSAWHEILDYFSGATHLGLTATPKETRDVSNLHYFGDPVYTYSLKQGIEDGFLAPYKVIRIDFDRDLQGWRPRKGQKDKYGNLIEDRIYNQKDFDRSLVLDERTRLVAWKITEYLESIGPYSKTIVFCEDIDHAERMRQALVNLNPERVKENAKYVMRITGDDPLGKAELDNFIDPEQRYPVIATTSQLMSTGVDAQTCKLVVLDKRIQSMTEFKQIIGRGTRINEDYGKFWFSIMDFKKATELFADAAFDGEPVQIYEPTPVDPPEPPDTEEERDQAVGIDEQDQGTTEIDFPTDDTERRVKYRLGNDVTVYVVAERVQYYGPDGKLITESLRDYTRKAVRKEYVSLDQFIKRWSAADKKQAVIEELEQQGVLLEPLADEVGRDLDAFDLICHVAFDQPPLSRRERAEAVKKRDVFTKYGEQARKVLEALLDKYADTGIENIEDIKVLQLDHFHNWVRHRNSSRQSPFSQLGTAPELIKAFGGNICLQSVSWSISCMGSPMTHLNNPS
jgi:type I restriction enzyme R subunit